jgi:2-succinyl-5-enolpyruvyl-6-hydroxy-3-cyclohexene-1-carboxylate synthase
MTEPGIARTLVRSAPTGSTLVVASSMPVREVEWWSAPRHGLRVLSNRGANGIDGVLSTALGVAASASTGGGARGGGGDGADRPDQRHGPVGRGPESGGPEGRGPGLGGPEGGVTALLGDLAFLYDAGALLWAADRDLGLDVVVVDNDGGGIFNFLAQRTGQSLARFERLWGTPHGTDLRAVARSYGVEAVRVPDLKSLTDTVVGSSGRGVRVLVATTDREANVAVHQRLNEAVAAAVVQS